MAMLPDATITTIFNLQRKLLERIDQATATEATLFEQFGETEETIPELEQLQNVRERAISSYTRLNTLLLRTAAAQPTATSATLNLLAQSIEQAQEERCCHSCECPRCKAKLEFAMNNQPRIPDPETRRRSVEKLREVCRMYDELNMLLDEAKARAEADIRNSSLGKAKRLVVEKGAKNFN